MFRTTDTRKGLRHGRAPGSGWRPLAGFGAAAAISLAASSALSAEPAAAPLVLDAAARAIDASGWQLRGVETRFEAGGGGLGAAIRIEAVERPGQVEAATEVEIACGQLRLTDRAVYCEDGRFSATFRGIGRQSATGEFSWHLADRALRFSLPSVEIAGGRVAVGGTASDAGIDIRFDGRNIQLDAVLALAATLGVAPAAYSAAGSADATGSLSLNPSGLGLQVTASVADASLANDAGTVAAEGVRGRVGLDLARDDSATRFDLAFEADGGEAYVEPVYANFAQHAFRLRAEGVSSTDLVHFDLPAFRVEQDTLLALQGSGTLALTPDTEAGPSLSAVLTIEDADIDAVYSNLLQVRLAGTVLGNLQTAGRVAGTVAIEDNLPVAAALSVRDGVVDDLGGKFAVYGVEGEFDWPGSARPESGDSRIHWDSGTFHNILFGGADVDFRLGDNDFILLAPLRVETMGGALKINRFGLRDFGGPDATGVLDAELEPVQLGQLSSAFGWPPFSGQLSGRLPLLQLAGDTATVGGSLTARAFDGDITVANLRVDQPFGRVPRLRADISMRGLDLERLTDTFSFGLIQGRLSGDVTGLALVNWRPVAMDLHFYTPAEDRSRHRISQRAVENLASVGGGGAGAVLSSGLLRFFEVFSYDRIGLRCVLADGVCRMSGAGRAAEGPLGRGYYIVKGSGLPRIDVVGYRDRVNWDQLVRQFGEITRGRRPALE